MRILNADEQEIVREDLCAMVERERGWKVCGVAESGKEAKLAQKLPRNVRPKSNSGFLANRANIYSHNLPVNPNAVMRRVITTAVGRAPILLSMLTAVAVHGPS
jgi:hypothetical protein